MRNVEKPIVSAVLPSIRRNNLEKWLNNIRKQTYPKDKLEIVIAWGLDEKIDDLKEQYGCKVIYDTVSDMEARRKTAIEAAAGEWIFMSDDDNFFKNPNLIENMMDAVMETGANAAECVWQYYDKNDYLVNRYCALVGVYDPSVYYLRRQDHMQAVWKNWKLRGTVIKETEKYFHIAFERNEIPTMGDQGFLIKKEDMLLGISGEVIMHMDVCAELINLGKNDFVFMKDYFGHNCVKNSRELIGKLKRNIDRFQVDGNTRKMNYEMTLPKMIKLGLILGTVIIPLKDAVLGFFRKPDIAWFFHPVLCFRVAAMYTWSTFQAKLRKNKCRER